MPILKKMLVVEDDREISALLSRILADNGYKVTCAFSGLEALALLEKESYDMALLDIMLPYKSGDEVLRELRASSDMPVIMLTAKDLTQSKVELLRLGADDYITKPFDVDEVLARIEAALRRYDAYTTERPQRARLCHAGLELDTEAKQATVNGRSITLTAKEYQILELMLRHPQKVFSKANLYESVWKEEYMGDENTLNVHMSNLRNKLKQAGQGHEYIETVWGLGYRMKNVAPG